MIIFFGTGLSPHGEDLKSNFLCISYKNLILLVFKKGYVIDVRLRGKSQKWRATIRRGKK
jgi:hypothetical protein